MYNNNNNYSKLRPFLFFFLLQNTVGVLVLLLLLGVRRKGFRHGFDTEVRFLVSQYNVLLTTRWRITRWRTFQREFEGPRANSISYSLSRRRVVPRCLRVSVECVWRTHLDRVQAYNIIYENVNWRIPAVRVVWWRGKRIRKVTLCRGKRVLFI